MEALIAAHLTETLAAELVTQIEKITFWSSSYKAFVGNRVSEIHTIMSNPETALGAGAVSWRYVPTGDNLTGDNITRGLHSVELNVNHHYSDGPEFVYKAAEFSPENKVEVALEDDKRKRKTLKWVRVFQESEPVLR